MTHGTQVLSKPLLTFIYRTITFCGVAFQPLRLAKSQLMILHSSIVIALRLCNSNAYELLHYYSLGYSPSARRYLGNRFCFLFLGLLRCFSSPGYLPRVILIHSKMTWVTMSGAPIRISLSHHLFAARQGLSQLATSVIGFWRLDIHHTPLLV